eukprot:gene9063-11101_t
MIIKYYSLLLLFIIFYVTLSFGDVNIVYVDKSSPLTLNCGKSSDEPCQSLSSAIQEIKKQNFEKSKIILKKDTYTGYYNKELNFTSLNLEISSPNGQSIIDCEGITYGFAAFQSQIKLSNLVFKNCVGIYGGGLNAEHSSVSLDKVHFYKNVAEYGGGSYFRNSTVYLTKCQYITNSAREQGSGLYFSSKSKALFIQSVVSCNAKFKTRDDIVSVGASSLIVKSSNITGAGTQCLEGSSMVQGTVGGPNLCSKDSTCKTPPEIDGLYTNTPVTAKNIVPTSECNLNGICESHENCLKCPQDCNTCQFTGPVFSLYDMDTCFFENKTLITNSTCLINNFPLPLKSFDIPNIYTNSRTYGNVSGFFEVPREGEYQVIVSGQGLGVKIYLNHNLLINSPTIEMKPFKQSFVKRIKPSLINQLVVSIFTPSYQSRSSLSVQMFDQNGNEIKLTPFYSKNVCNDGIIDKDDSVSCPNEKGLYSDGATCGDKICNETPESCLEDCYDVLGTNCPSQVEPIKNDVPKVDTVSYLMNNQFQFSLPGLNHLSHGIDLLTGEELPDPVFDFGYCDNYTYSTVQDFYRGITYNIPSSYFAEVSPMCVYNSESTSFSSSESYKFDKVEKSDMAVSFNANAGLGGWGTTLNAAYKDSENVQTAKAMEGTHSGSTISTKIICSTSTVTRNKIRFHSNFIKDLALVSEPGDMEKFIIKYGSLYYKSATLGGSLEVLVFVDSSKNVNQDKTANEKKAEISTSVRVSTPFGSGGPSYRGSQDSEITHEEQTSFETETSRSKVFTRGGKLGSFGSDYSSPSTFTEWSKSVDLRPVPIEYKKDFIGNIIPPTWFTKDGANLQQLWYQGYQLYLANMGISNDTKSLFSFNINFMFDPESPPKTLTEDEVEWFKNLTITFTNGFDEKIVSQKIKLPMEDGDWGCNDYKGCQRKVDLEVLVGDWEIYQLGVLYYDKPSNTLKPLNVTNYFKDIIIQFKTPTFNRGYMFNITLDKMLGSTETDTVLTTVPTPENWVDVQNISVTKYGLFVKTVYFNTTSDPLTNTTTHNTTTVIQQYYIDTINPLPVMYPNSGKVMYYMTASPLSGSLPFYVNTVGSRGTYTMPVQPLKQTNPSKLNRYRVVSNFPVGKIEDFTVIFQNGEPVWNKMPDDCFILWSCPTSASDPQYSFCVDEGLIGQVRFGYMKMAVASTYQNIDGVLRYTLS